MQALFKKLGKFIFFVALLAHFFLITIFFAPTSFLVSLGYEGVELLTLEQIPPALKSAVEEKKVKLSPKLDEGGFPRTILRRILQLREAHFMKEEEKLMLHLSILDFGEGVVGMEAASQYYFKKPLNEISETQWMTLINLHTIFD